MSKLEEYWNKVRVELYNLKESDNAPELTQHYYDAVCLFLSHLNDLKE